MKEVFSGVWFIRTAIGLGLGALISWGISFAVADYVVRANTASYADTFASLNAAITRQNELMSANTSAVIQLQSQISQLLQASEGASERLRSLQINVDQIAEAVQNAGIDIRVAGPANDTPQVFTVPWSNFSESFQPSEADAFNVFIRGFSNIEAPNEDR